MWFERGGVPETYTSRTKDLEGKETNTESEIQGQTGIRGVSS